MRTPGFWVVSVDNEAEPVEGATVGTSVICLKGVIGGDGFL